MISTRLGLPECYALLFFVALAAAIVDGGWLHNEVLSRFPRH
jgi:hypothetical protein